MKRYVAIGFGRIRRDYLVDAPSGPPDDPFREHHRLAEERVKSEPQKPLSAEDKDRGLRRCVVIFGGWPA